MFIMCIITMNYSFIKLNYEDELIQSKIKDFVNTIVIVNLKSQL